MKKIFAILLTLTLLMGTLAVMPVFAADHNGMEAVRLYPLIFEINIFHIALKAFLYAVRRQR